MSRSPTSKVISERRGEANFSRISPISSLDHAAQLAVVGQDRLELGDGGPQLGHLLFEVGPAQPGEPRRAACRGCARPGSSLNSNGSAISAVLAAGRSSDARMAAMIWSIRSSALIRPSTMWARLRASSRRNSRPAGDDLDLVVEVGHQRVAQVERAGDAVDQGHRVDREVGLQRRALVEVVEDHQRRRVALELDHDAHAGLARRLVVEVGHAVELAAVDQVLDLGQQRVGADLVGQRGDDDAVAARALPRSRPCPAP